MIGWRRLHCPAPPWRRAQRRFYAHRRKMLWRERVTPFRGGGRHWAIPYWHVVCESGADYHVGYGGAYGLVAAWGVYGGERFAAVAGDATPRQQDLIAHRCWVANGDSAWTPYEGGCE